MDINRIKKAIDIINHAIKHNISVSEASRIFGYASSYVKNVKALIYEKYDEGEVSDDDFSLFDLSYKNYMSQQNINKTESNIVYSTGISTLPYLNKNNVHEDTTGNIKTVDYEFKDENKKTISIKGDDNNIDITWNSSKTDRVTTLEGLLKKMSVNMEEWFVKDYTINKWDVTSMRGKEPLTVENFQIKARLERKTNVVSEKILGEIFKEMVYNYEPPQAYYRPQLKYQSNEGENNLFEITLFDLHLGKLAWGGETGENYDVKIATERFISTITDLVDKSKGFSISKVLFPIGNDFFNSDTMLNTTTKGTPQDEDLRWQKTFTMGTRLIVDAINILKQFEVPIDVIVIPGNHDFERSFYLGEFLVAWFNNDELVTINNGASPRKYYKFGDVLLGFTHGSEEKENALPLLMASDIESKPLWSETRFHEWHLGHLHRKRIVKYTTLDPKRMTSEELGVTIRHLSSLTGTEEWHHKKGFVGATKAGEAFIWNDKNGLVAHLNANLKIN